MKKHQDYSVRRLPGPAIRPLCEGVQTPEAHHELFRDWQRTQTQSSATAPWEPEAANRCLVLLESRDHRPRGHGCKTAHPDSINARSPWRATDTCAFLLTFDLHRCGQYGNNPCFAVLGISSLAVIQARSRTVEQDGTTRLKSVSATTVFRSSLARALARPP